MSSRAQRTRRRKGPAQGLWRVVVLALFLLGQGYGVVHHSVVEHHVCEVDGQLAHGSHGHRDSERAENHAHDEGQALEHDHDDEVPEGPRLAGVDNESDNESESEHGHDHCSVPTSRDEHKILPVGPSIQWVPLQVAAWVTGDNSQTVERAIPVFRMAPKQSPPSAA